MQYYLNEKAKHVLAEAGMPGAFITMDELKNPENPKVIALVHAELAKIAQVPKPNRKKGSNETIDVVRHNLSDIQGPREMPEWQGVNVKPKVDSKSVGLREDVFVDEPELELVPDEIAGLKSSGESEKGYQPRGLIVHPPADKTEGGTKPPKKSSAKTSGGKKKTSGGKKSGGSKRKRK